MHLPIWAVILIALLFSFLAAVGVNLQKLSMSKEESGPTSRPPYLQPLWLLGLSAIVLDGVKDFILIGMAPQSLLVPLGALSLGFNFILAPIFHNEVVTRGIVLATSIVYIGTIVTLCHAPKDKEDYGLEEIKDFALTRRFLCYEVFNACFVGISFLHGYLRSFGAYHYCALAGCFGGQTLLLAKCSSELLLNAVINGDWKISPVPFVVGILLVGTLFTQLNFLNAGLHKFEVLKVGPLYQCFLICFGITSGLVFFQEYSYMNVEDAIAYSIGIMILLIGVGVLVHQKEEASLPSKQKTALSIRYKEHSDADVYTLVPCRDSSFIQKIIAPRQQKDLSRKNSLDLTGSC